MARQVSIGELRARWGQVIEECRRDGQLCVVTRRGKPEAVLMPLGEGAPLLSPRAGQGKAAQDANTAALPHTGELAGLDAEMDSVTWGLWGAMSDEDRAAMIVARSLIRGSQQTGELEMAPEAGWGALVDQ